MGRVTYTDEEMAEFKNMDCPVKANVLVNEFCNRVCDEFQHNCPFKKLAQKLKYYEDKQDQGLLITPPLKVGDIVYSYLRWWRKEDGIVPYQITNITITQNKKGMWTKKYRAMWFKDAKTCDKSLDFSFDEIGKKAFLTEEALRNFEDLQE